MATFSVNDQVRRALGTGNGTLATFDFDFQVNATSDIKVYVDGTLKTETTHYTVVTDSDVAGLNTDGTGTVKFTGGNIPANNAVVTILSDVPAGRTSVYTAGGNITATSLEQDFDTLTMLVGDREERDTRALTAPVNDPTSVDMTLPSKDNRKGKYLAFNSTTGDPEAGASSDDVATLAAITDDIATLADIEDGTDATDAIQDVAAIASDVTAVANIDTDVTAVSAIASNVTAVANDATDIGAVAAKATEIGRLGTADAVSDLNTLGTADAVSDMNTLAAISSEITTVAGKASLITSDFASDLNQVAVADVISDINTLATSDIVSDLNTLATSDFVADLNLMATSQNVADLNAVASDISNVNAVATNIADVNNFADTYFVSATAPASPSVGDLWFDTTNDVMKVYSSGGFINAGSSVNGTSNRKTYTVGTNEGSYTGSTTVFPIEYDAGFIDVYLNGIKLDPDNDFTATNGTSVTLSSAAATGDIVDMVGFGTFELSNFSIGDANNVDLTGLADNQFLQYNSSTSNFEPATVTQATGNELENLSEDTTPQLGGVLDTNGNNIRLGDSSGSNVNRIQLGASQDLAVYHDGSNSYVSDGGTGRMFIKTNGSDISLSTDADIMVKAIKDGAVELYHDNSKKFETTSTGVDIPGDLTLYAEGSNNLRVDVRQGAAKIWCAMNGAGTISVRDSYNTSSIADLGVGNYTVNINNDMDNDAHVPSGSVIGSSSNNFHSYVTSRGSNSHLGTGEITFRLMHNGGTQNDLNRIGITSDGDLA